MSQSQQNTPAEAVAESVERTPMADKDGPSNGPFDRIKQVLLTKRSELRQQQEMQLDALHSADKHHLADLDEMSSDASDADSLCALVDMKSQTLEQVDAALSRIDEGTYGCCEGCGEAIASERLEALPFAPLCIGCQSRAEAEPGFLDELAERQNENQDGGDQDEEEDDQDDEDVDA